MGKDADSRLGPTIDPRTDQEMHFAARGWRPSDWRPCPALLAGQPCRTEQGDGECVCVTHIDLLDHARAWVHTDTGRRYITAEPYESGGLELAQFIADLTDLRLTVRITGNSPWNPGETFLIVISGRDD